MSGKPRKKYQNSNSKYNMKGMGSILYAFTKSASEIESKFNELTIKKKKISKKLKKLKKQLEEKDIKKNVKKSLKSKIKNLKIKKKKIKNEIKKTKKNIFSLISGLEKITINAKKDLNSIRCIVPKP